MGVKPRAAYAEVVLAKNQALLDKRALHEARINEARADREHAARMLTQASPVEQLRAAGMIRLQAPIWLSVADYEYLRELAGLGNCLIGDIVRALVERSRLASTTTTVVETSCAAAMED